MLWLTFWLHFRYCIKKQYTLRPAKINKNMIDAFCTRIYIFALFLYYRNSASFVEVTIHTTELSQHETLKGAHLRQVTLCVTFGALLCGTRFSVLRLCSKYSTIRMLLGTLVRQTTLSVTFGKRRRSIPVGLSDLMFDHSGHASRPYTPKRQRNGSAE